jgi:hypothetical protein
MLDFRFTCDRGPDFLAKALLYLRGQEVDLGKDIMPFSLLKPFNCGLKKVVYEDTPQGKKALKAASVPVFRFADQAIPVPSEPPPTAHSELLEEMRKCF